MVTCWGETCSGQAPLAFAADDMLSVLERQSLRFPREHIVYYDATSAKVTIELESLGELGTVALDGATVILLERAGSHREFKANEQGQVTIDQVEPGPNIVIANHYRAHATALFIFAPQTAQDRLTASTIAEAAPLGTATLTMVKLKNRELLPIVNRYLSPNAMREGGSTFDSTSMRWSDDAQTTAPSSLVVSVARDRILHGQVLSYQGNGLGWDHVRGTHLSLLRGGRVVGQATADQEGRFTFPRVPPGVHGIVAAGAAGFAAFSFEVVDRRPQAEQPEPAMPKPSALTQLISLAQESNSYAGQVIVTETETETKADNLQEWPSTDVAEELRCILVPNGYMGQIVQSIRAYYPPLPSPLLNAAGPLAEISPFPGFGGFAPGFGTAPGFGGAGVSSARAGGGGFGGGGLGGLAAIGAVAAGGVGSNRGSGVIVTTPANSPSNPSLTQ
jgi:hypothetical protein